MTELEKLYEFKLISSLGETINNLKELRESFIARATVLYFNDNVNDFYKQYDKFEKRRKLDPRRN